MPDTNSLDSIKQAIVQILKEEIPHFMKMAEKNPESVRTDLRDDAITDFLGALADLEGSFSAVMIALEKIRNEYQISDAAKDAFPFPQSVEDMYKKVIHWNATQTEVLTNRYLNAK